MYRASSPRLRDRARRERYCGSVKAVLAPEIILAADNRRETLAQSDAAEPPRRDTAVETGFGYSSAETAIDGMLFHCHDAARFLSSIDDGIRVYWVHRVHAENAATDP